MIRATLLFILASLVAGHQELSALYKSYKEAGGKLSTKSNTLYVHSPASTDVAARDKSLFFPPLPGQTGADYHPQLKSLVPNDTVVYYSWHIHVYFFHEDDNVTSRTLALRDNFIKTFSLATCDDTCFMGGPFDTCTQGMCLWDPVYGVDGPHPYGQWGVYLPNEYLAEALAWMSANHGEFEVLFHPNTGYMVGDHAPGKRAIWIKETVPLDLNFLIWLQCEWFGCNTPEDMTRVQF